VVALYLCSRFRIFDRPVSEKYFSQVEGGPHWLKSCLLVAQNALLPTTKDMHPSFESLGITIGIFDGHPP
jgi:hypothetical protein